MALNYSPPALPPEAIIVEAAWTIYINIASVGSAGHSNRHGFQHQHGFRPWNRPWTSTWGQVLTLVSDINPSASGPLTHTCPSVASWTTVVHWGCSIQEVKLFLILGLHHCPGQSMAEQRVWGLSLSLLKFQAAVYHLINLTEQQNVLLSTSNLFYICHHHITSSNYLHTTCCSSIPHSSNRPPHVPKYLSEAVAWLPSAKHRVGQRLTFPLTTPKLINGLSCVW